jgi:hypothetical protein
MGKEMEFSLGGKWDNDSSGGCQQRPCNCGQVMFFGLHIAIAIKFTVHMWYVDRRPFAIVFLLIKQFTSNLI